MDVTFYQVLDHPEHGEVETNVKGCVYPAEAPSWDCPGSGEEVEIVEIRIFSCTEMSEQESKKHDGETIDFAKLSDVEKERIVDSAIVEAGEADERAHERYLGI